MLSDSHAIRLRLSGNLQRHLFVQGFTRKLIKKGTTACKLDFHRSPFEALVHTGRAAQVHTGRASGYQAYDESSTTSFFKGRCLQLRTNLYKILARF